MRVLLWEVCTMVEVGKAWGWGWGVGEGNSVDGQGAEGWIDAVETRTTVDDGAAAAWEVVGTRAGVVDGGSARGREGAAAGTMGMPP